MKDKGNKRLQAVVYILAALLAVAGELPLAAQGVPYAAAPPPLSRKSALEDAVRTVLAELPTGARVGLLVTTSDGQEVIAIDPDNRFVPASNTKIFTTAATFATIGALDQPDRAGATSVGWVRGSGNPHIVLTGRGDARVSSAPDCASNCLATLADAVARKTRKVGDIIGDDSWFADTRWSYGMAWNNMASRSGTGISALSLDDNEAAFVITPGAAGHPVTIAGNGYFGILNAAATVSPGTPIAKDRMLGYDRAPGSQTFRFSGMVEAGAAAQRVLVGIEDPAHYTAWRFRQLLEQRGVTVTGQLRTRHRTADQGYSAYPGLETLATLSPAPLYEDVVLVNKISQNLHAELLLRRIGNATGDASADGGLKAITAMMTSAGVARTGYDFSDGSGMSTYNRVSPRATVGLLRWTGVQKWGAAWRETLPVGGIDGSLAARFKGTGLENKIFAKTGTVNQASSLSGFFTGASGKAYIFAMFVNDVPQDISPRPQMDKVLALIAARQ